LKSSIFTGGKYLSRLLVFATRRQVAKMRSLLRDIPRTLWNV